MCSVQGLGGEGWPGEDRHRASSERTTTLANPEPHEPFGVALALEFPHPCAGYFHLSNSKHSLLVPPMLEEGGISLHFKPLNPRPHREAIFSILQGHVLKVFPSRGKGDISRQTR